MDDPGCTSFSFLFVCKAQLKLMRNQPGCTAYQNCLKAAENRAATGQAIKKEATQRGKTASPLSLVTVLTTVTENREQEVMLSSPVSLAPLILEQSKCHEDGSPHIGYVTPRFVDR